MYVARIKDNIVVNLEVADEEWVAENDGVGGYTFAPYSLDVTKADRKMLPRAPQIGDTFDPVTGLFSDSGRSA